VNDDRGLRTLRLATGWVIVGAWSVGFVGQPLLRAMGIEWDPPSELGGLMMIVAGLLYASARWPFGRKDGDGAAGP
jgi:hypothetical protein